MNAQECRTLTTTRMHDSRMCSYRSIASMSQRALATYPAPERDSGTQHRILFRVSASSESVHDIGVRGRHLAMPLY